MHSVDLTEASWLIRPSATLVGKLESRIIIDSRHVGHYMGIRDLIVEAPRRTPTTYRRHHRIRDFREPRAGFTGTPRAAHFHKRVSVSVDLSIAGDDKTTLVFTPTGVLTGPNTANQSVPDDKRDAVLAAFTGKLPDQRLPFDVAPTRGRPRLRRDHRGHHVGINHHPRRIQRFMTSCAPVRIPNRSRAVDCRNCRVVAALALAGLSAG